MARPWLSSKALRERLSRFLLEGGGLLGLTVAALYVWVAPPHIVDGDNAEFSTLAVTGGTAHPSGYPLYLLWLRATSWLPGASPAHTAAIATALLGALTALVLHAACRAWGARPIGATIAAATFACAPVVIRVSSEAEVFALNNLVVATVLWLAAIGGPLRGTRRVIALGLVAGLGLANHMTCTLVAPIGLFGVVRGMRESARPRAVSAALAIGALVLGLLPYAYLLVTGDSPLSWGTVDDLRELFALITRQDYGGPGAFLPSGEAPSAWSQIRALGEMLARSWLVVGLVAGVLVLALRVASPPAGGETRWGWALLAITFVIAGPVLVTRFNLEPVDLGLYVCQRFYLLPALLLAIPIAVALDPLDALLTRRRLGERVGCAVVATIGVAALAGSALPYLARVHTPAVENYARNLLHALPRDAVVILGQDDEYLGIGYLQWARGERQDVVVVAPQLTNADWYVARIAKRGVVVPAGDGLPILRTIDALLAAGRPVFVEKTRAEVISARPTYPFATVMRVLPPGVPVPSIDAVIAENEAIFTAFDLRYPRPGPDDELATAVHGRYAAAWSTLGRKATQLGKPELAAKAYAYAQALGPAPNR